MPAFDRSMHRTVMPPASPARPRSDDVVIELDLGPGTGRQSPARTRSAPRSGCEPDCAPLSYFLLCPCGSETFSQKPIPECPCCHRKA
jgi:hypothetical protein